MAYLYLGNSVFWQALYKLDHRTGQQHVLLCYFSHVKEYSTKKLLKHDEHILIGLHFNFKRKSFIRLSIFF